MRRVDQEAELRRVKAARAIVTEVVRRYAALLARDTEPVGPDGYGAGGYNSGRTFDPRPTEASALALLDGPRPDEYHKEVEVLREQVNVFVRCCASMALIVARIDRLASNPRESGLVDCANPRCEASMSRIGNDRPRRGRCRRCYEYHLAHDRDWTPRVDGPGMAS